MNIFLNLFLTFAKVGVMTFGGGYAMLPILQREVVDKKEWVTESEIMDYYAIGQCTPGVIAVNTSTFIGYKIKGARGAICSTAGIIFPSVIIITSIAAFINNFADLPIVQNAFEGIRVAVCAIALHTIIKMAKKGVLDILTFVVLILSFLFIVLFDFSPVIVVVFAGVLGVVVKGGKKE